MAVYRLGARGGEVYRGISITEQAPLDGCKAPPGPLSFKLLLVVFWRVILLVELLEFRARHSGVSNPSLCLSYGVFRNIKATFVGYFTITGVFHNLVIG